MSSLGIVIAQISGMQNALEAEHKDAAIRRALGKPQACICQLSAILILLIGAWRFLQHQHDILRGLTKFSFRGVYLTGVLVLLARFCLMAVICDNQLMCVHSAWFRSFYSLSPFWMDLDGH